LALAGSVSEALDAGRERRFALILSSLTLPDGDGLQVQRQFQLTQPDAKFILMTESGAMASAVEALKRGAVDYLEKPLRNPRDFIRPVQRALALRAASPVPSAAEDARRATPGLCGSMVARDPRMLHVLDLLGKAAPLDVQVMLLGETGVGKEVVARCIHLHSRRAGQPFVAVHCAAAPAGLTESELFGQARGSGGGAGQRQGALERARGGTLFLDEAGELAPAVQAQLRQALRTRRFRKPGAAEEIQVDVRIISATSRDLDDEARQGLFDRDLYQFIGAFPIEIPPLRDRPADIDVLAEHFLAVAAAKFGKPRLRLSGAALFLLRSHAWPGNVRELENVIERAAILSDGEVLPEHLPFGPDRTAGPMAAGTLNVHELERRAIEEALRRHGGNRTRAARGWA
jgi:DNA-binding NtrC family response regulator